MTESKYPLVSIITPAYNQSAYLTETIESVLTQDYPNFEYIVLDDGSSDDTPKVLEKYNGRIVWESHPNIGEARTVNKGFQMAKGDYIVVVNADDPVLPGMIRTQVDYLQKHPEVLATYPDWLVIDENSAEVTKIYAWDYDYKRMVARAGCVPGPAAMITRRGLEIGKGRNTNYRYVTDMDFWFRIGLHGELARIPQFLGTHRTHPTSSGVASSLKVGEEILKYIQEFFANPNIAPAIKKLELRALSSAYYEIGFRHHDSKEKRQYLWKSLQTSPRNWLANFPWFIVLALAVLHDSPKPFRTILYRLLYPIFYRWKNYKNK